MLLSELDGLYVALDILPGVGLAGASLVIGASCGGGLECIAAAGAIAVGLGLGVGSAAIATTTDAVTGSWFYLTPGEIVVRFD